MNSHTCVFAVAPGVDELPATIATQLGLNILYGANGKHWIDVLT